MDISAFPLSWHLIGIWTSMSEKLQTVWTLPLTPLIPTLVVEAQETSVMWVLLWWPIKLTIRPEVSLAVCRFTAIRLARTLSGASH